MPRILAKVTPTEMPNAGGVGGNITSARWQVTLCDPIWHVNSHSSEACCKRICFVYFTYLFYFTVSGIVLVWMGELGVQERQLLLEEYQELASRMRSWLAETTAEMLHRNFPPSAAEMKV